MSITKKIVYMFFGSLLIFFTLAFVDEYDNIIGSFAGFTFQDSAKDIEIDEKKLKDAVLAYNNIVSKAYGMGKEGFLSEYPMDHDIYRSHVYEIRHLYNMRKKQLLDLKSLQIIETEKISGVLARITTDEIVSARYLDYETNKALTNEEIKKYSMLYTFDVSVTPYKLTSLEGMIKK